MRTTGTFSAGRLLRRLGLLALLLVAANAALLPLLPTARYARDYRPTWEETARYVAWLRDYHRRHPDRPLIFFLGPSTAWGTGASPGHAIPEEFGRLLHQRYRTGPLSRAQVVNLCLAGSNSATDYYLLRAIRGLPAAVYYQEHYRFFGPRAGLEMKPELVASLGLWPEAQERARLGGDWLKAPTGLPVRLSLACARLWPLYRDRFALRQRLFGDTRNPGEAGYEGYEDWLERTGREHRASAAWRLQEQQRLAEMDRTVRVPWPKLSRAQQDWLVLLNRNHHSYNFGRIRPHNRNLSFIARLLRELQEQGVPAFAYTAVLNRPVLLQHGLLHMPDFRANARALRQFHVRLGVPYVDYNELPALPVAWFHDVDHLVDAGTAWQAERLLADSAPFLEAAVAACAKNGGSEQ